MAPYWIDSVDVRYGGGGMNFVEVTLNNIDDEKLYAVSDGEEFTIRNKSLDEIWQMEEAAFLTAVFQVDVTDLRQGGWFEFWNEHYDWFFIYELCENIRSYYKKAQLL